jgi:hypothetical protein
LYTHIEESFANILATYTLIPVSIHLSSFLTLWTNKQGSLCIYRKPPYEVREQYSPKNMISGKQRICRKAIKSRKRKGEEEKEQEEEKQEEEEGEREGKRERSKNEYSSYFPRKLRSYFINNTNTEWCNVSLVFFSKFFPHFFLIPCSKKVVVACDENLFFLM